MTCDYCAGSKLPGIHLPSDFSDREPCRDGKVFVARCDECWLHGAEHRYDSDFSAAEHVSAITGWPVMKSFDRDDDVDPTEREKRVVTSDVMIRPSASRARTPRWAPSGADTACTR